MKLDGQRAVVFGGGSGAGLAAARRLAAEGAEVIIAGRDVDKLFLVSTSFVTGTVLAIDGGLPHASFP